MDPGWCENLAHQNTPAPQNLTLNYCTLQNYSFPVPCVRSWYSNREALVAVWRVGTQGVNGWSIVVCWNRSAFSTLSYPHTSGKTDGGYRTFLQLWTRFTVVIINCLFVYQICIVRIILCHYMKYKCHVYFNRSFSHGVSPKWLSCSTCQYLYASCPSMQSATWHLYFQHSRGFTGHLWRVYRSEQVRGKCSFNHVTLRVSYSRIIYWFLMIIYIIFLTAWWHIKSV